MTRAKIIDIIRSAVGTVLRIDNLAQYKESYSAGDMQPNTLVPWGLVQSIIPESSSYEISYTGSSLTINWQTDLIDGIQTYADALGNNLPKPFHYFKNGDQYTRGGVEPVVNRVAGDITTVVFDWGYSADVVIVF